MTTFHSKKQSVFTIFVLLALGSACERKGTGFVEKPKKRVQSVKMFDESQPMFCALPVEVSEGDLVTSKFLFATGCDGIEMKKALEKACKGTSAAANSVCTKKIASKNYECVHHSAFSGRMIKKGNWQCAMEYTVGEMTKSLLEKASTPEPAVEAAFNHCANVTGADEADTLATREACARAMIARKMVCKNLDDAPAPAATNTQRKVFR